MNGLKEAKAEMKAIKLTSIGCAEDVSNCQPLQLAALLYISTAGKNRASPPRPLCAVYRTRCAPAGCSAGDSSARQQAPTSGEEVQTVNMADELTVPRRGEPSPADSPPPSLLPSLSHPVTDAVQSGLLRGAPRGPKL